MEGRYRFAGLHFHWGRDSSNNTIEEDLEPEPATTTIQGSEHTVDGTAYSMELHIVHFKSEYGSTIGKG